jgi:hypothetical protein
MPKQLSKNLSVVTTTPERSRWIRNGGLANYLNVSKMTVWRWKRNPTLGFPPAAVINDIEFNDLDKVDAWMEARVARV